MGAKGTWLQKEGLVQVADVAARSHKTEKAPLLDLEIKFFAMKYTISRNHFSELKKKYEKVERVKQPGSALGGRDTDIYCLAGTVTSDTYNKFDCST